MLQNTTGYLVPGIGLKNEPENKLAQAGPTMPRPTFGALCVALFLESLAYTIVLPAYALYAKEVVGGGGAALSMGNATTSAGSVASATDKAAMDTSLWNVVGNLLKFVTTPIVGRLADAMGRRPLLLISAFAQPIVFLTLGLVRQRWAVAVSIMLQAVLGIAFSMITAMVSDLSAAATPNAVLPSTSTAVESTPRHKDHDQDQDQGPDQNQGRAQGPDTVSADVATQSVGRMFGRLFAAVFASLLIGMPIGAGSAKVGLHVPFLLSGACGVANVCFIRAHVHETLPTPRAISMGARGYLAAVRESIALPTLVLRESVGSSRLLVRLTVVFFVGTCMNSAGGSVFLFYTLYRFGWTPSDVALYLGALAVVAITSFTLVLPRLQRRLPTVPLLLVAYGVAAAQLLLMGFADSTGWLFWLLLPNLVTYAKAPTLRALMTRQLPPHLQGALQGAMDALKALGGAIAPAIAVAIFRSAKGAHMDGSDAAQHDTAAGAPFFFMALLCVLSAALLWRLPMAADITQCGGRGGHALKLSGHEAEERAALAAAVGPDSDSDSNDFEVEIGALSRGQFGGSKA